MAVEEGTASPDTQSVGVTTGILLDPVGNWSCESEFWGILGWEFIVRGGVEITYFPMNSGLVGLGLMFFGMG